MSSGRWWDKLPESRPTLPLKKNANGLHLTRLLNTPSLRVLGNCPKISLHIFKGSGGALNSQKRMKRLACMIGWPCCTNLSSII